MEDDTPKAEDSTLLGPGEGKISASGLLSKRALLVVLSENLFGAAFVLDKSRNKIGRDDSCDIVLKDPLVSREHCLIEADEEGSYFVTDLGSKNSTFLNRKAVSRRLQLFYGDRLLLGDTILRFFLEERVTRK
jgi:pSer/pThr/pTyr-binding forkhead associated (FHA) protein